MATAKLWRDQPEAASLLVHLGQHPPRQEVRKHHDLTTFFAPVYVGKAVRRLHLLYDDFGDVVLDTPDFDAWSLDGVDRAIDEAIAAAASFRVAA